MNSFIKWIGGKKLLRKEIIGMFPEKFGRYIEVFGGAGWVLFGKEPTAMEVYNDANGDLVNLFRCVKHHPDEMRRELNLRLNSREEFEVSKNRKESEGMTDIQRAADFYTLIKFSYAGNSKNYSGRDFNLEKELEFFKEVSKRLNRVIVENRDFEKIIKLYDREEALFYLDPPYHSTEKYYSEEFTESDHLRLCERLKNLKGKFILSYNNDTFIKELYKGFNIREISRSHGMLSRYEKTDEERLYRELIVTNY